MKQKYKSGLVVTSLIALTGAFVASYAVIGCGKSNPKRPPTQPPQHHRTGGPPAGVHIYSAKGYAPLITAPGDHIIDLAFYPYDGYDSYQGGYPQEYHYDRTQRPHHQSAYTTGSTYIEGTLFLAGELGIPYLFNGWFGGFQYNGGYHQQPHNPYYDNCSIPAGQYEIFTEYPAIMNGTTFSGYQLIAQGYGGVTLLLTPTQPSFIAGFNSNTGQNPYVSMQVIVERLDPYGYRHDTGYPNEYHFPNTRYCSRHFLTFGAPPLF